MHHIDTPIRIKASDLKPGMTLHRQLDDRYPKHYVVFLVISVEENKTKLGRVVFVQYLTEGKIHACHHEPDTLIDIF